MTPGHIDLDAYRKMVTDALEQRLGVEYAEIEKTKLDPSAIRATHEMSLLTIPILVKLAENANKGFDPNVTLSAVVSVLVLVLSNACRNLPIRPGAPETARIEIGARMMEGLWNGFQEAMAMEPAAMVSPVEGGHA